MAPPPVYGSPPGPHKGGYGAPTTSSNAVISLVTGIASWIVCPFVLAIVAIVFANKAREEIRMSGGAVGGEGLASAGRILGIINLIFMVIVIVATLLILIVAAASSS